MSFRVILGFATVLAFMPVAAAGAYSMVASTLDELAPEPAQVPVDEPQPHEDPWAWTTATAERALGYEESPPEDEAPSEDEAAHTHGDSHTHDAHHEAAPRDAPERRSLLLPPFVPLLPRSIPLPDLPAGVELPEEIPLIFPEPAPEAAPAAPPAREVQVAAAPASVAPAAEETLVAPPAAVLVAAAAAGAGAAAAPLLSGWRRFAVLALLYTRIAKERLLDHERRDTLLNAIRAQPGVAVADLVRSTGVPRNSAVYHLMRLEREGLVSSQREGRTRLYFAPGSLEKRGQAEALAALRHDTSRAMAREIGTTPGLDQNALCGRLGLAPSLAHWHADRLVSSGIVEKRREGRHVRYYPGASFSVVSGA